MNKIRIKTELKDWLIDNITNTIHDLEIENSENFNKWAKTFKKENAELVVNMEFINDWGYDEREYITSNPQAISMAISIAVKSLNTMHHDSMSVNFVRFLHTFPFPHNAI